VIIFCYSSGTNTVDRISSHKNVYPLHQTVVNVIDLNMSGGGEKIIYFGKLKTTILTCKTNYKLYFIENNNTDIVLIYYIIHIINLKRTLLLFLSGFYRLV